MPGACPSFVVRIVQRRPELNFSRPVASMVSVVLVPIEVATQLPATIEALQQGLECGDFANLKPVQVSGGVLAAEVAVKIALADVAHCYELSSAGCQLCAARWEALVDQLEYLASLLHLGRLSDEQLRQN